MSEEQTEDSLRVKSLVPGRPVSPSLSDVSVKSDRSKGSLPNFSHEKPGPLEPGRPVSPSLSDVSVKSDRSKGSLPNFSHEKPGPLEPGRPVSPSLSDVSVKSDRSKGSLPNFSHEKPGPLVPGRPVSPSLSDVSVKSDRSKGSLPNFSHEKPGPLEPGPVSPSLSDKSVKSDQSKGSLPNFSHEKPGSSSTRRNVESNVDLLHDSGGKQGDSEEWKKLISALKDKFRKDIKNAENKHPNHNKTEHIMKEDKTYTLVESVSDLFKDSGGKRVRTVLTVGEGGIGKSFHVERFIKDWAEDKKSFLKRATDGAKSLFGVLAKDDEGIIIPLDLSKLRYPKKKKKKISLEGLLHRSFQEIKKCDISNFEHFKVLFILDGLDQFEPALTFDGEEKVTDVREQAPLNVVLTSLIRGTLLPSTQVWITSRPSAVHQLPDTCVDRRTEIRYKTVKHQLKDGLKRRILSEHENKLREQKPETELYEIDESKNKEDKVPSWDALFPETKKEEVKTVLMKGVPGVGKTQQTIRHMVDWAKGRSNTNIDFIVPLHFSELNSIKVQSMKDLLQSSLNPNQTPGVVDYDKSKILFVLDGLEQCELPLRFEENKNLTDVEEPASMDVLLTSLMKGTLLPSALIWIITQPSGAEKIPPGYIQKVTECRETSDKRKKLVSALKKRFRETIKDGDLNHLNQTNTEHIMREEKSHETSDGERNESPGTKPVIQVNAVSEIFKERSGNKPRNVLTTGVAGIGKSFHVDRFIKKWADEDTLLSWGKNKIKSLWGSGKDEDAVIFPLNFSEIKLRRERKVSLFGLLNHFFKETKEIIISNYEKLRVLFVLDGLDAFEPALNFNDEDKVTDVREPASVNVVLTSLIRGTLLPSAQVWITSRPSAVHQLPDTCVNRRTEIRHKADLASKWAVKEQLTRQYSYVAMGVDMQKTSTLLNDIYTDLYIIEGERGEVEAQHETKQIEGAKFKPQETAIKYHAIFKPPSGNDKPIRSVLTLGMAGIGKSFATMKYMLDWADDKSHEDIFFMFPLSFRELNLREEETHSLEGLIHSFFPAMKKSEIKNYDKYPILIVLDGFDECRLGLVFDESNRLTDVTKETSVKVLLANLIQGNLLPNAQIWITSRPAASNVIPADKVDRVTEVRGFNDEQKEEYFKKRFEDKDLAETILSHVKKSRTLYIMCHIPVFCWLTSKVLEDFVERKEEGKMPSTLTDMYIHFLLLQCRQANAKYGTGEASGKSEDPEINSCWNSRNRDTVVTLGKLAFEGLKKGDLVFTEDTLKKNGVDAQRLTTAVVFSGILTQIKREGPGLHEQKLFCFVHLSIQEFMASLFVFHTFNDRSENLLTEPPSTIEDLPASDFYKTAVDKALSSENGYWDLFLRFLLGLSLETNQVLLQELLKKTENNKETNEATISYIKEKIREEKSDADQNFNLFHCLNELNDQTLADEAKMYLRSETTKFEDFSTSQWSALNFVLLTSGENLDEFELKKYRKSEHVLLGLMPVVKVAKSALLSWCELTEESCHALKSSILNSLPYNLTKLDLSHNDLLDAGVKHLAEGLKSSRCKLEVLKLSGCQVTEEGCSYLASALGSNMTSSLKELDLSYNHPGAKGAVMLSDIVRDPKMSLRKLCLDRCGEHCLQPGIKKYEKEKQQTKEDMKSRILIEHESKLREQEPETELYEIDQSKNKEDKVPSWDALFPDSEKEEVKTVLMKGVPGVGKTQQTIRHMVDWAKGGSNTNIDFIVPLHFHELNSNKVQSLKDLLQSSLYPKKIPGVVVYDECKILFVLDGLEQCELPLRFEENKNLTDVEEPASMDVLLTSLMKGTLLPSALIWIITQPSGAEKIPPGYIEKVTECRETLVRRKKLVSALKKSFREAMKDGDLTHPNQTNTEHIMREEKSHETSDEEKNQSPGTKPVIQVNAVSEIFKDRSGNKPRNVLTTGVAGIGKSFHVDRLIKEWADEDEDEDEDAVLFPFHLCELKLRREEKVSLFGLLNHFYKETKEIIISNYEKLRVLFVLDGLDAFKPALNLNDEEKVTDVREPASVNVLLTSLIRGSLLPSAQVWITSRPSAVHQLPDTCVETRTEIRHKPDLASKWAVQSQLKRQFTHVAMGVDMQKTSTLLNDIYTDLYIIEGERGEVDTHHDTKQIEGAKFKPQETAIKYHVIFKPPSENDKTIRSVLTTGMAGIGKSFTTMKYMLDWAEDKSHEDIFFMFPLSFRELNLRKEETYSLEGLIHSFFPAMRKSEIKDYDKYPILIVLDGFDECRLGLVFDESNRLTDVTKETSVKVLLANLIQGNLLPNAQIWITSQPAASNIIPADKVDRVTEVRGFNDEQKEEYFKKRFDDKDLAEKILSHVKKSRTLYNMCHIPVFCWLTSKVLEDFVERKEEGKMPSTQTDMYIHFLLLQCRQANVKYGTGEASGKSEDPVTDSCWNSRNRDTVVTLGKLAFEGLKKGDLVFTEETLAENGVDIKKAAVFSGIFTQIKREGPRMNEQKLFRFVHLSIQEFMASLSVFHTFNDKGENLLTEPPSTIEDLPASDFYKTAVDKALSSKNGDWDWFLRFLLGLSLETNQVLLQEPQKETENNNETNEATISYIKEKIREEKIDTDQKNNLFHCLNELNDQTLVDEVQKYLSKETTKFEDFSTSQWSALNFVLLTSGENLDEFELKKYRKSEKVLLGLMPVVKVAKTALLSWCELTEESCHALKSSIYSFASCNLTKLDLSHNDLLDAGVKPLAEGLKSSRCELEVLKLSGCQVTEEGCSFLVSALRSNTTSSLKELDLSYNHPGANGAAMLSDIEVDPKMSLTTLCLDHCGEQRLKPGMKKYDGSLKLDENTAGRRLILSDDKKRVKTVWRVEERVQREENKDRFKRTQVSCEEGQKGLCYWEVEWKGTVGIAVAYRGVERKWDSKSGLGCNAKSWSLLCSKNGYKAIHGKTSEDITEPFSQKIAVLLDWEAGTLSYYCDKSGELSLIHTFKAQFTEPVYPGFWFKKGSVTLCEVDKTPHRWSEVKAQTLKAEKGEEKPKVKKSVKTQKKKEDLSQVPWRS